MFKSGSHSCLLYKTILYVTIVFSGHYDSQEGSPSYVLSAEAIQDLQQSINSTEVRSFLFWDNDRFYKQFTHWFYFPAWPALSTWLWHDSNSRLCRCGEMQHFWGPMVYHPWVALVTKNWKYLKCSLVFEWSNVTRKSIKTCFTMVTLISLVDLGDISLDRDSACLKSCGSKK